MSIGTSCDQHNCFSNHCTAGLLCPCECHNRLMDDGAASYRRYPPDETPGAALVAMRWEKQGDLECAVCSVHFDGRLGKSGPRYCSNACRQWAWRQRKNGTGAARSAN